METPILAGIIIAILYKLLPYTFIITVVLWINHKTKMRIDDLRTQSSREHDKLWHKVDSFEKMLIEHVKD